LTTTSLPQIWLIGGTSESAEIAQALVQNGISTIVSVTTAPAKSLYPRHPNVLIRVARFDLASLRQFLQTETIVAVIDASHPFAVEISQLAIAASQAQQIPYLRYERPRVEVVAHANINVFSSFAELLTGGYLANQRVLLSIGYRHLAQFQPWQTQATLFARILPSAVALAAALEAGFTSERLIALRPPISIPLERALWQHWQISMVVTKASGEPGGEGVKQQLAIELNLPLMVVQRPQLEFPRQTSDLEQVIAFARLAMPHSGS
jgi:precorrin-6A/cobalt-precorrin-6A reductase